MNRFRQALDWDFEDESGRPVRVFLGPILSGEKLVDNEEYRDALFSDFRQAIDMGQQALELLHQTNQPVDEARVRAQIAASMICIGDTAVVSQYLQTTQTLERRYGFTTVGLVNQHLFALLKGDLESVDELGGEQLAKTMFLQLAVSKEGKITGTYSNTVSDTAQPVEGQVDRESQRAAWWIGDNRSNDPETGIHNLTQDETPVLVHFGTQQTQTWLLVRLEDPTTEDAPGNP